MHHVAFRGHQRPLPLPQVVGNMVAPDTKIQSFFRYPEVWKDIVFILLIQRREHQHESRDVRGGGKIQPAVADASFQIILRNREGAGVPLVHRHPADGLLHPLVQPELPESVLLARILLGGLTGGFDLVDAHRNAERGVCFLPHLGVRPILILGSTVNDRIKGRINLPSLRDVDGFLVYLVADGVGIVACCGDQEI